jgi:hypothetical protein
VQAAAALAAELPERALADEDDASKTDTDDD